MAQNTQINRARSEMIIHGNCNLDEIKKIKIMKDELGKTIFLLDNQWNFINTS